MTILTKEWWAILKKWAYIGTRGSVAVCAILNYWLMLKAYWPTFFGMAQITGLIKSIFL
jgi:hypothetical protein